MDLQTIEIHQTETTTTMPYRLRLGLRQRYSGQPELDGVVHVIVQQVRDWTGLMFREPQLFEANFFPGDYRCAGIITQQDFKAL